MFELRHPPELVVIVPTYHEVDNIGELTRRIFLATSKADIETELIIIDDNSMDGTEQVCKRLEGEYPLRLVTRTAERGLATAVLHGIRESKSQYVLVMDADLSHPPEDVPRIFEQLKGGADFVVGSRYVKGGGTDAEWGFFRWLNSKVATLLARGLTNLKDPMAGFFGFPRSILDGSPELLPVGYKIGLEILVKANCQNVVEIPIAFAERVKGQSKLSLKQQILYLQHLRRLYRFRFPQTAEIIQFAAVGSSGVIVDLCAFLSLTYAAGINHQHARALSFVCAASWNWYLNRWFTFVAGRDMQWKQQWAKFLLAASTGFMVNWGSYKVLTDYVPYFTEHHLVAFFTGILLGMGSNYTLCRWFVFRQFDETLGGSGVLRD
jgi:dolichol-phosphate mannosyltransferase